MKFVFLAGGFAGFLLAVVTSYWVGHQPDLILLDGALGSLAGALLFRWFWTVLVGGIRQTILIRHSASTAPAAPAAPVAPAKP